MRLTEILNNINPVVIVIILIIIVIYKIAAYLDNNDAHKIIRENQKKIIELLEQKNKEDKSTQNIIFNTNQDEIIKLLEQQSKDNKKWT